MFVVPVPLIDAPENRFFFGPTGKEFSIPKLGYVPLDVMDEFGEDISIRAVAKVLGSEGSSEAIGKLGGIQIGELTKAWLEESKGVTPGESSASGD